MNIRHIGVHFFLFAVRHIRHIGDQCGAFCCFSLAHETHWGTVWSKWHKHICNIALCIQDTHRDTCTCTQAHKHAHTRHTHILACTHIHMHMCTCACTCNIHTHTHTHTHMQHMHAHGSDVHHKVHEISWLHGGMHTCMIVLKIHIHCDDDLS